MLFLIGDETFCIFKLCGAFARIRCLSHDYIWRGDCATVHRFPLLVFVLNWDRFNGAQ